MRCHLVGAGTSAENEVPTTKEANASVTREYGSATRCALFRTLFGPPKSQTPRSLECLERIM